MPALPLSGQLINLFAAFLLLLAFAMLTQRRILSLINLFALQGFVLALSTAVVAFSTNQGHLYLSAAITFGRWDVESVVNIPVQMLIGIALVIFAFNLAAPISQFAGTITKSALGIATASILLSFLMMITRRKAVSQVIGFLAMENGLFFAATSATYGMPMVVELGILFDVLVGALIFGVFFFHIRETFESLDIHHLEKLKER
jgi:hydrogenase-4 component E